MCNTYLIYFKENMKSSTKIFLMILLTKIAGNSYGGFFPFITKTDEYVYV